MALSKAEIVSELQKTSNATVGDLKKLVDFIFRAIKDSLAKGQPVKLASFGNFSLRDKKARIGRDPKTLKAAEISARTVVCFHAGDKLRKKVGEIAKKEYQEI